MLTSQSWVVCEQSGRWAAALRTAFARFPNDRFRPRLYEVRTLAELVPQLDERRHGLALVEIRQANLTEALELLTHPGRRISQFVALLDETVEPGQQHVADVLREAGAAEVVESPLRLGGLLALHNRLASAATSNVGDVAERQSFADWAWSALPWQDP